MRTTTIAPPHANLSHPFQVVDDDKNPNWQAKTEFSHLVVTTPDGRQISMIFTDLQIATAILASAEYFGGEPPEESWLRTNL